MRSIWPAITFSALTAVAIGVAIAWGFSLTSYRDPRSRRAVESRAALAAGIGAVLLIVAVVFWISYLIFGPIHDTVREIFEPGD